MPSSPPSCRSRGERGRRVQQILRLTSRRTDMKSWFTTILIALTAVAIVSAAQAEVFVYPKQGQSQDAFQKDQYECHNWAQQQTGFNPAAPPQAAAPPPAQGGVVRGGARGAAVGAVGGAIAGDAGKGAAVGAAVGGTATVMRNNRANREQEAEQAQYQQAQAQNMSTFNRAQATCLQARGYSVN